MIMTLKVSTVDHYQPCLIIAVSEHVLHDDPTIIVDLASVLIPFTALTSSSSLIPFVGFKSITDHVGLSG